MKAIAGGIWVAGGLLLGSLVLASAWSPRPAADSRPQSVSVRTGEQWYSMRSRGEKVGWLRLTTREKEGAVLLDDELFFNAKGEDARTIHRVTCRPNEFLSPTSLLIKAERPQKPWTLDAAVTDGLLQLRAPFPGAEVGRGSMLPSDLATELAVLRLVTLAPKRGTLHFSMLEFWEKPAVRAAELRYDGEELAESVDLPGAAVPVSRFTLTNPHSADRTYWVDAKGRLVRMRIYGHIESVLTDEKDARDFVRAHHQEETVRAPAARNYPETSLPAFPGAEGYGSRTRGGRGGKVIEITSLADSGPGTLRAALQDPHPRIVVFRVGGTIALKNQLSIDHPFVTVAGQTAPGGGILLRDAGLAITTHDVVIRHLRVRPETRVLSIRRTTTR